MAADGTSDTPKHTSGQRKCSERTRQNLNSNLDPGGRERKKKNRLAQLQIRLCTQTAGNQRRLSRFECWMNT